MCDVTTPEQMKIERLEADREALIEALRRTVIALDQARDFYFEDGRLRSEQARALLAKLEAE